MENSNRITQSQMPAFPAWLKKKPGTAPTTAEAEKQPGPNDEAVAWALSRRRLKASAEGATTYNVPSGFGFAAFVDHDGPPAVLTTDKDDPRVAEGMVATAIEKGWSPIHVDGTPEFKSQAFRSAAFLGVEVTGYTPTADDLKFLKSTRTPVPARFDNQIQPTAQASQEASSPAPEQQQKEIDTTKTKRSSSAPSMSM